MKTRLFLRLLLVVALFTFVTPRGAVAFYDSNLGRWVNRDPIGEAGGHNLHRFVWNSPLQAVDAWGLDILPANTQPDPFCAADCEEKLGECMDSKTVICSMVGGGAGGAAQVYNKTGTKPRSGVAGGGKSGKYTSRTRLEYGNGAGKTIGRAPVGTAAAAGAAVGDIVALGVCWSEYGNCLDKCPRASNRPAVPLIVNQNAPPTLWITQ